MKISVRKKMLRLRGTAVCAALAFMAFSGIPTRAQEAGEQTVSQQAEVSLQPPAAQTLPAAILPQAAAVAAGPLTIDGDELKVYVAVAVAQGSAELDHINVQFTNTQNDRSVTKILRPEDFSEGVYADWISMSIYEPAGTYILDRLILQDENGAYVRYCRAEDREEDDNYLTLPFTAAFQIDNGVTVLDETAPVLGAVAVSPVQAGKKTEITVAAAVADDFSGVDSVTVRFESEKGDAVSVELSDAGGGLYTGTIKDSETDEAGTYRVKKVTVSDRMGNSKTYYGGDGPFASDVLFVIS
ncbi:MAG TPA: hypothetical protein H9761_16315 [Candidatus Eisenbergiella merdavium]|uniref:Bacterial Ig-like domain-containing protein n=1 Tax=Candidatus Eisenbergiella merdavium TaxID=2838551 RepID=A0A9D2NIZ0_9FIRM|nr:hypothetical protein [Candidatus Eisenbergiella merdavium]